MKLLKIKSLYDEIIIENIVNKMLLLENTQKLNQLLQDADNLVFEKFKIKPSDKVYFIAGSARLYTFNNLREKFNLPDNISDLDIIIPDKKHWINAGLEKNYNENGIYRINNIEVFTEWKPELVAKNNNSFKARDTQTILKDADLINGYYYMPLIDIIFYKLKLNREKEQQILKIYKEFEDNPYTQLKMLIKILGMEDTRKILGIYK